MIRYLFRTDEPVRIKRAGEADPQVIGEALAALSDKAGGALTPRAVVDAARNPRHALHQHFEWDDRIAAEAFRLDQARSLIRIIRVEDVEVAEGSTRAFLSINDRGGVAYRPIDIVKRSSDLQAAVLQQAERDLEAFERRYRELKDVCAIVVEARRKLAARRARAAKSESRASA